ncbi:ribosomal protein S18-alanine N-acetyltransferase [Caldalkalibacillus mannanilyticus]|uniref:ribosomal protein S18-alanine N-acetyltransferase n=1 Tax=Caldalkalibacillus mannanilyticus TaxID=1418 RepID=UPI001900B185|nr:ribosomal protein S18-alanine N-acetyltransferase [Caldalkalibacillus mannanilyticus]
MVEEDIHFRLMKVEDIPGILEVEHQSFTTPWTADAFYNELINNHFAYYIIAEMEHKVVGYCGVWVIVDEAHITNVAVHPEYRGRKIGEYLMRHIISLSMMYGAAKMTLEVRVSNRSAQNLYKKLGFTEHGIRKGYYTDNHEDAIIMWVNLDETKGIN